MNQIAENKFDETTGRILDAAWERLSHYGLGKTTMAEIAADCGMSAANLYRYFKNKNDIAVACCERSIDETAEELRAVIRDTSMTASSKLKTYALTMLTHNLERNAGKSKIGELVANMADNNRDFILKKVAQHHSLIAEILAQGNANDEFEVNDVLETAEHIYTALLVFDVPIFADFYSKDHFASVAEGIVQTLVKGISKK